VAVKRSEIVIVTPALADANNGNWQTARRWAGMLSKAYRVRLAADWEGGNEVLMIALHARRSAASVAQWRALRPKAPLVVVLTGTDLYRDIATDSAAQASLHSADCLVVLNELGEQSVPADLEHKVRVILQSCTRRQTQSKTRQHLRALMIGHLRAEKSPETYFDAAKQLAHRNDILLDHAGAALEPALGAQATALMSTCLHYRWLGALTHGRARQRIQAAHVLVHPSRMEGGAHVVIEAVRSGTPVLASRIDGNVGLLGERYEGYFPVGDSAALASLLERTRDDPAMLARLQQQCEVRAALFEPARERESLLEVSAGLLTPPPLRTPR
jgi:putative glycosyltransferase (TIGR04348 family)